MPDQLAQEIVREWERARGDWGTTLSHWQQVSLYLFPDRADFTTERSAGQKRMQHVFDATPLFALEMGAAGLHSMLTSDTMPWFSTGPDDEALARDDAVRAWFDEADRADYRYFNSPDCNFAPQSHAAYKDVLAFGPAVMAVLPSERSGILFSTSHLKECVWFENEEDRVDHLNRRFKWSAKKAFQRWGAEAGDKVLKALEEKPDSEFWFHHRVKPRLAGPNGRDPQRGDGKNKPFESVYVSESDQAVISEEGFDSFPYMVPRLERIPGEPQGRGRGQMMLPDIQMLNALMRITVRGAEKRIDPPLMLPDDGFLVPIRTEPGSFNYYRAGTRPSDRIAPIELGGDIRLGIEMIQALRSSVERGFFNNLLMTPTDPADPASAGKGVTATFTAKQQQEQMRSLSPLNSRLNAEWSAPLVERVRYINFQRSRARRFGPGSPYPPPPAALRGARWHCRFKSPIALAQRAAELTAIDQLMARQVQLRQIDPNAAMIVDSEAVMRLEGRDLDVPAGILKSPRRLQQEAAGAAQMAQQQHQAEIASQGAGAVADLAGAHAAIQGQRAAA